MHIALFRAGVLCVSLFILAGCEAGGHAFRAVPAGPDSAVIYAYRHGSYTGSGVNMDIKIDGVSIGALKPNGYLYKVVPAGSHMVACSTETESAVEIIAKPEQSYYIEGEVVMGFWVGRPKLMMVTSEIGRGNIGGKKYSGSEPEPAPVAK